MCFSISKQTKEYLSKRNVIVPIGIEGKSERTTFTYDTPVTLCVFATSMLEVALVSYRKFLIKVKTSLNSGRKK